MRPGTAGPDGVEAPVGAAGGAGWEGPAGASPLVVAAAALFVVAMVGMLVQGAVPGDAEDHATLQVESGVREPAHGPPLPAAARAPGEWVLLPEAPVAWTQPPSLAWTGRQVLAFGPTSEGPDLLTYDPGEQVWRVEATSTLRPRSNPAVVWVPTASEGSGRGDLIVWGGAVEGGRHYLDNGAAFDARTRRWRPLTDGPLTGRAVQPVVVDGRVLLAGGFDGDGVQRDAAFYDPSTDAWGSAPTLTVAAPVGVAASNGRRVVVVFWDTAGRAVQWRPGRDAWRVLPAPPTSGRGLVGTAVDARIAVWGPQDASEGPGRLLLLDDASGRWEPAPPAPIPAGVWPAVVSDGDKRLFVLGRGDSTGRGHAGAVYDTEAGTWGLLPPSPAGAGMPTQAVWAGAELVVVGTAGVAAWRPAAAPAGPQRARALHP